MSTPSWLNDVHPFPGETSNAFPAGQGPLDYNVAQQYQQRMQNGNNLRNGSPAFQNSMYQTQPTVPTKRPREDSIGASPRQDGNQTFQPPNPYNRFPNAPGTASLSPSIQNQQFHSQAPPSRVQTGSPSPFSPAGHNFVTQASPPPQSEHSSRVNTPHSGGTFMQNMPYIAAPNQPFTPPLSQNNGSLQPPPNSQQQQQQRMQEMRHRQQYYQQMQVNSAAMQSRYHGIGTNPSMNPTTQMVNMAAVGGRMQHPQPNMRPTAYDQFVRNVASFMHSRGLKFIAHFTIAGRQVNLLQLFTVVIKLGGSKAVTGRSQWPHVAQGLQIIAPAQLMMAAGEIQNYWQSNMIHYEAYYLQNQQQRQRAVMHDQMRMQRPLQNGEMPINQDSFLTLNQTSTHIQDPSQPHAGPAHSPNQNGYVNQLKRADNQQSDGRPPNGYLTPHLGSLDGRHQSFQNRQMSQVPDQSHISPSQPGRVQIQATKVAKKSKPKDQGENAYPRQHGLLDEYSPTLHNFAGESTLEKHGGLHIGGAKILGDAVTSMRPMFPELQEMGLIDIRALTLSLKSGIPGEVRLALDTLCALSLRMDLELGKCDDLVDTLLECAEEQVEFLAENATEVSDVMLINTYEEMLRGGKAEHEMFQVPPEYGSLEYDLERGVDKLICITTILRNFSSSELNCVQLANSTVIAFLANVMRYLGTRNMLLRTHKNTLDFSKDVVFFFSNVSQHIDLPSKEEALCVLHFLLAFAPSPTPTSSGDDDISFATYEPSLHCYLPHAIDSFAKLLAKDEPNRGFFRTIFHADGSSSPSYDLLTRAFGFAISVLPKYEVDEQQREQLRYTVQARGPYMAQGLLAAEIIVGLIPAAEHSLSRTWLSSQDGFAASLTKMVLFFGALTPPPHHPRHPPNGQSQEAEQIYIMVAYRGIAVLRKLAERAKDAETDSSRPLWGVLPGKEALLMNLMKPNIETGLLRQIHSYAIMDI
ncbi:MAG: hypothetical protein Q9202_004023 [Teloschistes flavicans]